MTAVPFDVPVDPGSGQARDWIIAELSRPEYQAARPTWFDRASSAFWDWISHLTIASNGVSQGPILLLVLLVVIAAIVAAYFVFGPPRLNRRSTIGALFGENDDRDAAAMRRSAAEAALRGEYTLAIEELFRALARGLAERTVLTTSPGTTANSFAARAGDAFPALAGRLASAATHFDSVRYLGAPGTVSAYNELMALDADLRSSRPVLASPTLQGVS
jgi:hypothetical protein